MCSTRYRNQRLVETKGKMTTKTKSMKPSKSELRRYLPFRKDDLDLVASWYKKELWWTDRFILVPAKRTITAYLDIDALFDEFIKNKKANTFTLRGEGSKLVVTGRENIKQNTTKTQSTTFVNYNNLFPLFENTHVPENTSELFDTKKYSRLDNNDDAILWEPHNSEILGSDAIRLNANEKDYTIVSSTRLRIALGTSTLENLEGITLHQKAQVTHAPILLIKDKKFAGAVMPIRKIVSDI